MHVETWTDRNREIRIVVESFRQVEVVFTSKAGHSDGEVEQDGMAKDNGTHARPSSLDIFLKYPVVEQCVDSAKYGGVDDPGRIGHASASPSHHRLAKFADDSPSGQVVSRQLDSPLPIEVEELLTGPDAGESRAFVKQLCGQPEVEGVPENCNQA
jgi:hypothetical protein